MPHSFTDVMDLEGVLSRLIQRLGGMTVLQEQKGLAQEHIDHLNTLIVDERSYVLNNVSVSIGGAQVRVQNQLYCCP
jgi:hypothetical protein